MPAALPADWSGIRVMAAQGHSLRALSEMTGISEGTLFARSAREGWKVQADEAKALKKEKDIAHAVSNGQMQAHASSGHDTLLASIASNGNRSKLALGSYTAKASERLDQLPDDQLLAYAQTAKALADTHSKLYPEQQAPGMVLNVFAISANTHSDTQQDSPVVDV